MSGMPRDGLDNVTIKQLAALTEIASFDNGATSSQITSFCNRSTLETLKKKGLIDFHGAALKGSPLNRYAVTDEGQRALREVDKLYERAMDLGL